MPTPEEIARQRAAQQNTISQPPGPGQGGFTPPPNVQNPTPQQTGGTPPPTTTAPTGQAPPGPGPGDPSPAVPPDRFGNVGDAGAKPDPNAFDFEGYLRELMLGSGRANEFTNPNVSGVPSFTPGANPFAQNSNRFGFESGGVGDATRESVLEGLNNPSRFDSQTAQDTFDRLNASLQQQFGTREQGINTDLARRGIFQSTVAGGKLGDLGIENARAQSDLAGNIALEQARTFQGDRTSAIQNALGFDQQQFGQQIGQAGFNFNTDLSARGFNQGLAQDDFNNRSRTNQTRFDQGLQSFGANEAAQGRSFNERNTNINNLFGFGQQQFNNQLDTARFNSDVDFRNNDQLLRSLGLT